MIQPVELETDKICELTAGVWSTVLGLEARPLREDPNPEQMVLTGCVEISGAWQGMVLLDCAPMLARRMAATMLDAEEKSLSLHDVYDALGEIANIVAGNIKAMLPGPSSLSLPKIGADSAGASRGLEIQPMNELLFDCDGERLVVRVLQYVGDGDDRDSGEQA